MASLEPWVVTLPDTRWEQELGPLLPGWQTATWDVRTDPEQALGPGRRDVRVVVLPFAHPATMLHRLSDLPRLELVQTLIAGYDAVVDRVPAGLVLASATGVHDASTAELAVGLVLASLRGIDDAVRDAGLGRWQQRQHLSLADRRVLVVGVGAIGSALVDRLDPFEVEIVRVASRARTDARGRVHGAAELAQLLPTADVVVLVTPLNESTRGLADAQFLAAMPDGALLVNVGRGAVVDTAALLAELRSGRLRAALDVVDPEPLPPEHPLWTAPGLVLTPHVGGLTSAMRPRAHSLLVRQLTRLRSGEPLLNVVPRAGSARS